MKSPRTNGRRRAGGPRKRPGGGAAPAICLPGEAPALGHWGDPAAITLDAEFAALVPPPAPDELARLEEALLREGCREPLVVWRHAGRQVLLVGYEAYDLLRRHRLPFRVIVKDLPTRDHARLYILRDQLARRHLTRLAASYLRGLRFAADPRARHGGARRGAAPPSAGGVPRTAAALAATFGVSRATIYRDAEVAAAVQAVAAAAGPDAVGLLLSRSARVSVGRLLALADQPPAEQRAAVEHLRRTGRLPRPPRADPPRTITLPYEPAALAAAVVRRLGPRQAAAYAAALAAAAAKAEGQRPKDETPAPAATDDGLRTTDYGLRTRSLGTSD